MEILNLIRNRLFTDAILVGFCQLFFTLLVSAILGFLLPQYSGLNLLLWGELIVVLGFNYYYGHKKQKFFECIYGNFFMLAWLIILLSIAWRDGGESISIKFFYSIFPGVYSGTLLLIFLRKKSF